MGTEGAEKERKGEDRRDRRQAGNGERNDEPGKQKGPSAYKETMAIK